MLQWLLMNKFRFHENGTFTSKWASLCFLDAQASIAPTPVRLSSVRHTFRFPFFFFFMVADMVADIDINAYPAWQVFFLNVFYKKHIRNTISFGLRNCIKGIAKKVDII